MTSRWLALRAWDTKRWTIALGGALIVAVLVAVPTAVIPSPVFGRAVAVTWWSYPTVVVAAILGGLLIATYVNTPQPAVEIHRSSRFGMLGGLVSFFAVGCPVCNKIVLLALGSSGALAWFAPVQPLLAIASLALMAYALHSRLGAQFACPLPPA